MQSPSHYLLATLQSSQRDTERRPAQEGDDIHTPISASLCSKRGDSRMVVFYIRCQNQSASSGTYKLWASNLSIPKKIKIKSNKLGPRRIGGGV